MRASGLSAAIVRQRAGYNGVFEPTSDRGRRIAALAQQLRVLHNELVDQSADMRSEQLRDRVQRELSGLPPHEREEFLHDLMHEFPIWSEASAGTSAPAPTRSSAQVATEIKDPGVLADQLIAMCKGMGDAERAGVAAKLARAGLTLNESASGNGGNGGSGGSGGGGEGKVEIREVIKEVVREVPTLAGLPEAAMADLKKMLGVPADGTIRADRIVEMCTLLAEFTIKLEPWACAYWQDIGKDAKVQIFRTLSKDRPNERQGSLARFAEGDPAVSKENLAKDFLKLRSLVSLLLKGVMDAGKQFGKDHMTKFAVDAVQGSAEKGTFTESQAAKNWKQYVKLMDGLDAATMEKRLKNLIAKDVDVQLSQVIR